MLFNENHDYKCYVLIFLSSGLQMMEQQNWSVADSPNFPTALSTSIQINYGTNRFSQLLDQSMRTHVLIIVRSVNVADLDIRSK